MKVTCLFWMALPLMLSSVTGKRSTATFLKSELGLSQRSMIQHANGPSHKNYLLTIRCGGDETTDGKESDEERYSRQVYTLGARAHGLVRSCTIYLDGPQKSGLVYECGKNLALSGVGHIVVLTNGDDKTENTYHNAELDDLGQAYDRAARSELGHDGEVINEDPSDVLVEYLQRLNPSVGVSKLPRSVLEEGEEMKGAILLCADRPHSTQMQLNDLCRKRQIPFVSVQTAGVYGQTFCDFGASFESFDVDGETPLVVPLDHIETMGDGDDILVHCVDGERHDVSKGDKIQFQLSTGEMMPQSYSVAQVQTPQRFIVRCESSEETSIVTLVNQINSKATTFSRVKVPQQINFLPLGTATERSKEDDSLFAACDLDKSWNPIRKRAILCSFEAVQEFVHKFSRLPTGEDTDEMQYIVQSCSAVKEEFVDDLQWQHHVESFATCCAAKFTPIQALFGAIGAQEALKAASGLYNPVRQFLLYDCDELLASKHTNNSKPSKGSTTAPGQTYILGQSFTKKLASKQLFVVGAGAIGCELLKNLSTMGAGTGKGRIIVTDMDTIERSNLSRQLLFRDTDIGKFKSTAAHDAVLKFNPNIKIEVHTSKVGDEDHGPFDDAFWSEGINIILNALDNVEARLYMDGQCVANSKALIDAGTLGSKGNVQVVIPKKSECYSSSTDPPEPAIPVCTLKNFPYAIAHTIQWGRDLIEGLYQRRPTQANEYASHFSNLEIRNFALQLEQKLGADAALKAATELQEDFALLSTSSLRTESTNWAVEQAKIMFHDSIVTLLRKHPADSLDEDGDGPFWSGARRVPNVLTYSDSDSLEAEQQKINDNLVQFVRAAARLRIETVTQENLNAGYSLVTVEEAVSALSNNQWETKDEECKDEESDTVEEIIVILSGTVVPETLEELSTIEFEKDDETNGHVTFVTAASNLRALCYGIAPVDAMETRRVAGKIVPAMITTTAFVSALSCIELLKVVQKAPLKLHRNAFINLALPFFAFTTPLPAEEMQGLQGQTYTLWDRIIVKEGEKAASNGGITLRRFIQLVKKKACSEPESIDISSIAFGPYMMYANFLHEEDEEMMNRPVLEILKEAITSGDEFDQEFSREDSKDQSPTSINRTEGLCRRTFIDLTVVVEEGDSGEEVELPPVRLMKWRP